MGALGFKLRSQCLHCKPLTNEPSPRAPQKGGLGCETQALMVEIQSMRKEAVFAYLNINKVRLWDVRESAT